MNKISVIAAVSAIALLLGIVGFGYLYDRSLVDAGPTSIDEVEGLPEINPVPMAVIGDSYSRGSATGGPEGNWTRLLARDLYRASSPVLMEVSSVAGADLDPATPGTPSFASLAADVLKSDTRLVVAFGARSDTRAQPNDGVRELVDLISQRSPQADFMMIGAVCAPVDDCSLAGEYNRGLAGAVDQAGGVFVDPVGEQWFQGQDRGLIGVDGIHPTNAGYIYIAGKLFDRVNMLLT
ncbi:SGNH/GDSL hydrolase family protein [Rhodococcus sp. NPDC003994]